MQTRSETKKMEEAAEILVSLSQPTQPVRMRRTLSYVHESYERAMKLVPRTKHGDTILMNFYIDKDQHAIVKYMKNEEGVMKTYTIRDHYDNIHIKWTYQVTDFPFYKEEHPIPFFR